MQKVTENCGVDCVMVGDWKKKAKLKSDVLPGIINEDLKERKKERKKEERKKSHKI
jgi:hypothetical protein